MRAIVTGGAGFIGSTLTERLLADGAHVTVIDAFTDYYDPVAKRRNLAAAVGDHDVRIVEGDLADVDLTATLTDADCVFHLAGQPGVRSSWSDGFDAYVHHNIVATQRLLEAARRVELPRLVYASSSSVYGNAERFPTTESDRPEPFSPYGVTKLAAEQLCNLYATNWGISTVSLRYFTVYGPRQRPDMAHHRLIRAALDDTPFTMFGDGSQRRGFTFVDDVVEATHLAGTVDSIRPGTVLNVAGPFSATLAELIEMVGTAVGREVPIDHRPAEPGDASRTGGAADLVLEALGWSAVTDIPEGISAQVAWHRSIGHGG